MSSYVTLDVAQAVIEAARKAPVKIGVPMNIAVVDEGANLVAFAGWTGAGWGASTSPDKAFTARAFDITTELGKLSQPGQPLFGIDASNENRVVIFAGGIPLKADGKVVGAVGASGGQPDQDHEVAQAGVDVVPGGKPGR